MKCNFLKGLGSTPLLSLTLSVFPSMAQVPQNPAPDRLEALQDLADQVKVALQRGDLDTANRLSSDLMLGIFRQKRALEPNPQEKFAKFESAVPKTGSERFYALDRLAKAAFEAGDLSKAEAYARELLAAAPGYLKDWNYGNAIYDGNMVLGRVAVRRDKDVPSAKSSLLASAQTPGSPQLNSFGPNMSLAKDLLALGERDTVLDFFTLCRKFWKSPSAKLDQWSATAKGGGIPDFGANLAY